MEEEKSKKRNNLSAVWTILIIVILIAVIGIGIKLCLFPSVPESGLSYDQVMNILYPDENSKYDVFSDNLDPISAVTTIAEGEVDDSYSSITISEDDGKIKIYTHKAFDFENKDYNSVQQSINPPKDEIVKIVLKSNEGDANYLEFAYFLTRNGDLYYYTHDDLFAKAEELHKVDNIANVVNIEIGSTLRYSEEFLNNPEDVCLDNDGLLIATTYDGSVYALYPVFYETDENGNVVDTYEGIFNKIK